MVLKVDIAGSAYLADVGFGSATLSAPLKLRSDQEQETPHEVFRLIGGEPDWRLQIRIGEEWRSVYSFDMAEQRFDDLIALNDRIQADPNFRDNVLAARAEKSRRITLRNRDLRIHPAEGGETERRRLEGLAEVKEALSGLFGIALPAADRLDPAIERALEQPAG